MFEMFYQDIMKKAKYEIYSNKGFFIFKNFIQDDDLKKIVSVWTQNISFEFDDFKHNKDVRGTNKYAYFRPSPDDFAYCTTYGMNL